MSDGYVTLLGLISHEYFHTWNVKHLRPAEFTHYDYAGENYTQLLWFFEGFTSYYDDLLLCRAGLIDDATYIKLLNKTINQVLQTPGREVQSVAQASFDAWVKYYRQDENTANATVSYYTKGALVALCFDLTLRAEGHTTLDEVMRTLWQRCKAGPMAEADFAAVLKELGGRAFNREIAAWVHGTRELPLEELLQPLGVAVLEEPAQLQQRLGLRVTETTGIVIKTVLQRWRGRAGGLRGQRRVAGRRDRWGRLAHDQARRPAALRRQPQESDGSCGARSPPVAARTEPAVGGDYLAAGLARPRPRQAVAGRARLSAGAGWRLAALLAIVVLVHVLALDWFARRLEQTPVLRPLATPMFTRLLRPEAPVACARAATAQACGGTPQTKGPP